MGGKFCGKNYQDLIGDILEASGEKDNFKEKGKGKPLPKNYVEKDIFQNFQEKAKDAGYLPAWLKLQKEISSLIHAASTQQEIDIINEEIKKYNKICPPPMQKMRVYVNELDRAKRQWA